MEGLCTRFRLLSLWLASIYIITIRGEVKYKSVFPDVDNGTIFDRKSRDIPSLYPGSFDYCKGATFTEKYIVKGSGSVLKVLESKVHDKLLTWFQAAACCLSKGLNLGNINGEADLKAYHTLRNGDWTLGWSDIHGFSNDWRNLYGVYPQGDIWLSGNKPKSNPVMCTDQGVRSTRSHSTFHIVELNCDTSYYEAFYCEEDDPLVPKFNYDCDNSMPEGILWKGPDNAKFYFENILKYNPKCEGRPLIDKRKFAFEDDRFLVIKEDNQRCRSLDAGQHPWPGRCDIFFMCSPVGDPKLKNYNADVYKCAAGTYFEKPTEPKDWKTKWPCKPVTENMPCKNAEPAKFLLVEDDIVPSKGKLTWKDAYDRCVKSGLVLATVENKEDNEFLLNNQRLKQKPYNDNTKFWTAGKMAGTDFDDSKLYWEPSGKTFPNHNAYNSNGVSKKWDEFPVPKPDKGIICLSMRFPGTTVSYWSISDCNQRNYYICMRETKDRGSPSPIPVKIEGDEGGLSGIPLTNNDVVISKGKLSWQDAFDRCKKSGLVLGSVENEDDNIYLSNNEKLHSKPYDQETRFWTAGKMKGARFDDAQLFWESTGKLFPNHMTANANGVNKLWDEPPNPKPKKGIMCLDINFPTNSASMWTISDCNEKRYYICMRLPEERGDSGPSSSRPPKINDDVGNGGEDEPEPEQDYEAEAKPSKKMKPIPKTKPRPNYPSNIGNGGEGEPEPEQDYEAEAKPSKKPIPKPKTKPRPNSTPKVSPPAKGTFIPDATLKILIRGTLKTGRPSVFTPDNVDEALKRITPGTFLPDESMSEEWPYSALHGSLKPYAAVPGSSIFVPDSFISGEFKPDSGSRVFPGSLTQQKQTPSIFTPDSAPYITKPIFGTWKLNAGALPNHPCQNVHGKMAPVPGSETEAQFTPDSTQQGVFIPDATLKQIRGSLSQKIPPEFTPTVPSQLMQKPTSGTWRPNLGDSNSYSHGIMKLSFSGYTNIFVPDEVLMGHFVPDQSGINPIEGYMTISLTLVFSTPDETADLSRPIPGTWKPKPGQRGAGKQKEMHGILKPDSNVLPPFFAFFVIGTSVAPANPEGKADFVADEGEEDCDPALQRLGTNSKYYVSCKKGQLSK